MKTQVKRLAAAVGLEQSAKTFTFHARMAGERVQHLLKPRPTPASSILLAGSGRGGTTWLGEQLDRSAGVQPIFEPFHPAFVHEVQAFTGWTDQQCRVQGVYLRPEASAPEWQDFIGRVLAGRVRNYWTDMRRASLFPRRYLIKEIRSNLMLGFIAEKFAPAIIHLVRHPCAVVHSRICLDWKAYVDDLLAQETLVADYLAPYVDEIRKETDQVGAHAVWWAVENRVAMEQLEGRPHHRVFYEAVCLDPASRVAELCEFLNLETPADINRHASGPSRMARPEELSSDFETKAMGRLSRWRREFPVEHQHRVLDWAHRLGVSWYDESPLPVGTLES